MNLRFSHVDFSYGHTVVCRDVSWQLPPRGVVCLWGPSGCGKTTLLRLLAGLEQPAAGQIEGPRRVSMVVQEDRLLPWLTARENVMLPGCTDEQAAEMLERLGLAAEMDHLPSALSGGQQRRVALARALASPGDVLLLDEPFNGLDETTWRSVLPLIQEVAAQHPVVLVTHVRQQAEALDAIMVPLTGIPLTGKWQGTEILQEKSAGTLDKRA